MNFTERCRKHMDFSVANIHNTQEMHDLCLISTTGY